MAKLLLAAGARTSFENVVVNFQQNWLTVKTPEPDCKPTLLHYCAVAPGNPPNGADTPRLRALMATVSIEAGADVFAKCAGELPQVGSHNIGTALDFAMILGAMQKLILVLAEAMRASKFPAPAV